MKYLAVIGWKAKDDSSVDEHELEAVSDKDACDKATAVVERLNREHGNDCKRKKKNVHFRYELIRVDRVDGYRITKTPMTTTVYVA